MQFYPNNIPGNELGFAVSASIARTGSFIANFSAILVTRVNTASLALNQTGSAGAAGTGASLAGPKGPQGIRGVTGPRGDSVYLISSSWHDATKMGASCSTPAPTNCWTVNLYSAYQVFGNYTCDFSTNPPYNPITYYTTSGSSQAAVDANFGAGFPLYTNNTCTDTLASALSGLVTFPAAVGAHTENGQNSVYAVQSNSSSSLAAVCYSGV
jgi:hypothetical protein